MPSQSQQSSIEELTKLIRETAPEEMKPFLDWFLSARPVKDESLIQKDVIMAFPPRDDLESEEVEYMWQIAKTKPAVRVLHKSKTGDLEPVIKDENVCHLTCMVVRIFEAMGAHADVLQSIAREPKPNPKSPWAKAEL